MVSIEDRLTELESRSRMLEKGVSRYRKATAVLALLLVAGVTMGQTEREGTFDRMTCRSLVVRDGEGRIRILLGGDDDDAALTMYDSKGTRRAGLTVTMGHPALDLYDEKRTPRASFGLLAGIPHIDLRDRKGTTRIGLRVIGAGEINLFNGKQEPVIELSDRSSNENGETLAVYNKTGESIATIYADEYGNGVVGAWNRKGKGRTLTPGP